VYRPGPKILHVDALSRNSVKGKDEHFGDELHLFHMGLNEDDWVMVAQMSDALCKQLHTILSNHPTSKEEIRVQWSLHRVHEFSGDFIVSASSVESSSCPQVQWTNTDWTFCE
jgi:hypothetical protein